MRSLIIASTILVPSAAVAGGYVLPNESPRELALSQAAVADSNSADAIFINTAALAGQEGLDIAAGDELLANHTDWSAPTLGSSSINTQTNTPPTAAVSYGHHLDNGMAWGAGVGVNVPAGGSLYWPNGWQGQEYIQTVSQQVWGIGAGAAFQPTPYFKFGVSYLRFQAEEELHQSINYVDHFGDAGLAMSGGANGFGAAIEVDVPQVPLKFGFTYSHAEHLDMTGNAHFTQVPTAFQSLLHDQDVTETLIIPDIFWAGAAYTPIPNLTIMGAFNYERWSPYKSDTFVGAGGFMVVVPRNYKDAQVYRIGAEWEHVPFLPQLTLRAGALYSNSPQPTDTVSPSLTDGNSIALSVGAGFNVLPSLRIDVGYQHAFFSDVTASGTETLPGTYKTQVDLVSLGLNFRTDLGLAPPK
jgi:long-subunit fatty acid transport protein